MRRRVSQLDLALEAGVSSRHISFVETGRAQASREMVLTLARVLDVPLRDRNALLIAAGYAPMYRASDLGDPALEQARRALDLMLQQQEPYPAIVVNGNWTLLKANDGATKLVATFADLSAAAEWGGNAMRLMFHPRGLRPHIVNWEAMAAALIQWVHRDVLSGLGGEETRRLLDELLSYPGIPPRWRSLDVNVSTAPFLPIEFRKDDLELRYFSTLTTLGTPHDVTLQELRVEAFFPADRATEEASRRLA
jgi:transcriptional regulator with XRE-family HTH domain